LTGLTISHVQRRAAAMGLLFTRERYRWTDEELDVVEKYSHLSIEHIQRKLREVSAVRRTRSAIATKVTRSHFRGTKEGMCHQELARALGISPVTLRRYRVEGLFSGTRLPSLQRNVQNITDLNWFYPNASIRKFVFAYPGMFDHRKIDWLWFIELVRPPGSSVHIEKLG
jgi:hypothetical protein